MALSHTLSFFRLHAHTFTGTCKHAHGLYVCVFVCVREKEGERKCVCDCVCVPAIMCVRLLRPTFFFAILYCEHMRIITFYYFICMCVYVYLFICVCIYISVCLCVHIYTALCCLPILLCSYTNVSIHIHVRFVCSCVYMDVKKQHIHRAFLFTKIIIFIHKRALYTCTFALFVFLCVHGCIHSSSRITQLLS